MIQAAALKRSRTTFESFDMSEFEEASKQVEESIAFPTIEWSFDEDDEELSQPSKRQCHGLSRSSGSFDLASMSSFQQRQSNLSLC